MIEIEKWEALSLPKNYKMEELINYIKNCSN